MSKSKKSAAPAAKAARARRSAPTLAAVFAGLPQADTFSTNAAAAAAAELICRDGRRWSQAVAEAEALFGEAPEEAALDREVRRWLALFGGAAYRKMLAAKRRAALSLMRAFSRSPAGVPLRLDLIGRVLSGAATEDSAIELLARPAGAEAAPSDPGGLEKSIAIALASLGLPAEALPHPWPTPFARANRGRFESVATLVSGEPVIIRIPHGKPVLPAAGRPDPAQLPTEAASAADAEALASLIEAREAAERTGGDECGPQDRQDCERRK